jgi:hypothetical protein
MSVESVILTDVEQAALALLASSPMTQVHVNLHVKFRFDGKDFGNDTILNQSIALPVPAVWAKAYPEPINFNHNGIELQVTLGAQAPVAPAATKAVPGPAKVPISVQGLSTGTGNAPAAVVPFDPLADPDDAGAPGDASGLAGGDTLSS